MGILSYSVADSEFDDDEVAEGTELVTRFNDIKTFLNNANLTSANLDTTANFPWTGRHSFTINDSSNTNIPIIISAVMAANKYGMSISSSAAQVNSALVFVTMSNVSSTVPCFEFSNAGTGSTVKITNSGNADGFESNLTSTSATQAPFIASQAGTGAVYEATLRTLSNLSAPLFAKNITTLTTVDNTATETAISDLSITLPADFLKAGTTIRGTIWGTMDTPGAGPATARIRVCYGGTITGGGTALLDTGAYTPTVSLSGSLIKVDYTLTCLTTGATGTIEAQGMVAHQSNTAPTWRGMGTGGTGAANTSAITIDTTASKSLVITFTWGSAVSGCTAKFRAGHVEILK